MAHVDYYTILGVTRQTGSEDLKRAYRRLAIHWHPDRNPGSRLAEERFKVIAEAYAVLSHPAKRRQYDRLGPAEFKNEYTREDIFQGFEPGDFFKSFGQEDARETLGRMFSPTPAPAAESEDSRARVNDFFAGFGQKNSGRGRRAPDITMPLMVTFKEAALGAEKYVAYNGPAGAVKVRVTVPPGALGGQRLVAQGQGPAGPGGGRPGDLIITLNVAPDPQFSRRGYDLLTSLTLTARELTEGCRSLINTLSGQALRLNVPAGTRPGASFKLPGYGLTKPDGAKGDLLVRIKSA